MPIGRKVSVRESQEWLESVDDGKPMDQIARKAGRSISTVRIHVARARQDRDQREVFLTLLQTAYQQHYDDLLELIREIGRGARAQRTRNLWRPADTRSKLLLEALKSHLPRARLWAVQEDWEATAARLEDMRLTLKGKLAKLVHSQAPWPETVADGWTASFEHVVVCAVDRARSPAFPYERTGEHEKQGLTWGAFSLTDGSASRERADEMEQTHQRLVRDLYRPDGDQASVLRHASERWSAAGDAVEAQVETFLLRRVLPGRCSLCPGRDEPLGPKRRAARRGGGS